jgi:small subunit ribosomal protein S1
MDNNDLNTNNIDELDDFGKLLAEHEGTQSIKEGEIVEGTVIMVTKDFVMVDIGHKSEGRIPIDEFIGPEGGKPSIAEEDVISVYVDEFENEDGLIQLSKDKADKLRIWDEIDRASEAGELVEGVITGRVKGGLTVDIGVKAFLPGSQVDLRPVRNLDKFIGESFQFKIIKFNKRRGNIVLSRRALLERERQDLKEKTLERIEEGVVLDGIVKNITDYGCFVDLGGIDGLLHITDMSWGRVNHPSEMFRVGDEVKVKVLKFDAETERVSLGLKQISEDPWVDVGDKYAVGQKVTGKVVSLTEYGAFVELEEGVEGLVHISEMSWLKRIKHPSQMVSVSDILEAMVLEVDVENRRMSLGMKQVEENPWETLRKRYPEGAVIRSKVRNITNFGVFVGIEEGIDGLIHVSDLSWSTKPKNPLDMFKKGQEIEAKVLSIDVENQRFSLGIKQLHGDPWVSVDRKYPIGTVIEGNVSKVFDFGAVVEIDEEIEGLVHISELADEKVPDIHQVVQEGQTLRAKVISLIPEERKIGLSVKRLLESEALESSDEFLRRQKARTGTVLGDLLKKKLGDKLTEMGVEAEAVPVEEEEEEVLTEPATIVAPPAEEAPVEAEAVEEAPAEEAPVEAEAEVAEEAPAEEAPVEAEAEVAEAAPAEEAPVEAAAEVAEAAPAEEAPVEAKAEVAEEAPAEEAPVEAKAEVAEEAPAEEEKSK